MKRELIIVPKGIRYINEFSDYSLKNFSFPHILNKQITGCGFTEYCLTNDMDIILCSPRKILLENKEEQHLNEVFYFKNEFDTASADFDKDLNASVVRGVVSITEPEDETTRLEKSVTPEIMYGKMFRLKKDLLSYIEARHNNGLPVKILVTYDSFKLVRDFIEKDLMCSINEFNVVIDEFQSIMIDSRFKSNTELAFLSNLVGLNKICFVSATPMLDPYLELLDEFKNLPYYELDWGSEDPCRIMSPSLIVRSCKSLLSEAKEVVNTYLNGDFKYYSYKDQVGNFRKIESKEAVLYFNSVKNICDLIKKCNLTPDNTNVLCSRTEKNLKKINKAFRESCKRRDGTIGSVPKRGEPHKMFTLCTRTVYLGADFYSTNAQSFVFSDANIDCLAVDISLDLPQILGRQRLDENPWKNSATVYFKNLSSLKEKSRESFNSILDRKTKETEKLIKACQELVNRDSRLAVLNKLELAVKVKNYETDYFSVDYDMEGNPYPVFNNLVKISEMRAFDVQQVDYKNRFSVFSTINSIGGQLDISKVDELLITFDSYQLFQEKMRYVCEEVPKLPEEITQLFLNRIPMEFSNYYHCLGPDTCRALKYQNSLLKNEYERQYSNQKIEIESLIFSKFSIGGRYSYVDIKNTLTAIFNEAGYKESPKATILRVYFEVRPIKLTVKTDDDKAMKVHGFEILSRKE